MQKKRVDTRFQLPTARSISALLNDVSLAVNRHQIALMGRRKHRVYHVRKVFPLQPPAYSLPASTFAPHLTCPTPANHDDSIKPSTSLNLVSLARKSTGTPLGDRRLKGTGQRRNLQRIVTLLASVNWGVTLLGYLVLKSLHGDLHVDPAVVDGLKGTAWCLSMLQTTLVVYYWKYCLLSLEVLREVTQPQASPQPTLLHSPLALATCTAECLLHLCVFLPAATFTLELEIFGKDNGLSLDELSFLLVLIRNYHSLRLIYWYLPASTMHTYIIVDLVGVTHSFSFVLRCFLAEHGPPLVLAAYGTMVLIPGLFEYILEHDANASRLGDVWNNFWVVFYTQTTIGYGDGHPVTFFGQVMILVSAIFGYFTLGLLNSISTNRATLSLKECSYYSEMRYSYEKQGHLPEAIVLIQRWWRFMMMRMRKKQQICIILPYFAQLHVYRNTLVSCMRVKDSRFERQISAFESAVKPHLRSLQEYLSPIRDNRALIIDMHRSMYNFKSQCIALQKRTQKYSLSLTPTPQTPASAVAFATRAKSNKGRAKAKKAAFQNLISRLVPKPLRTEPMSVE